MKDTSHLHDFKVDKPEIFDKLSDLCMVFTTDGLILMAQYGSDGYWHTEGDETFGNVTHWYDGYPVPHNFKIDYERYGGGDMTKGDLISRQAVLDIWHTQYSDIRVEDEEIKYKKIAYELPSVENKGELIIRQAVDEINSEIPKIQELFDIAYEYNRKDSTRTELSQKCTTYLLDVWQTLGAIVDNYSPAENNEDTISREAYEQIKWERDTAIQQLKDLGYGLGEKPKDNKGDLISRRAVTDIIERKRYKFDAIAEIERLPSVENKGEWIYDGDCIHCSSCKSAFNNLIGFNFCPNCGADMRGE